MMSVKIIPPCRSETVMDEHGKQNEDDREHKQDQDPIRRNKRSFIVIVPAHDCHFPSES